MELRMRQFSLLNDISHITTFMTNEDSKRIYYDETLEQGLHWEFWNEYSMATNI